MANVPNGNYRIFCAGDEGSKRWLVSALRDVKLHQDQATSWTLEATERGTTISADGSYLGGNTSDGKVRLIPAGTTGSGMYWEIKLSGQYYVMQCQSTESGDKRFLDGNTNKSDVYLHDDTTRSGSQWLLIPA